MFGRVGNRLGKMKVALQCIWEAKLYSSVLEPLSVESKGGNIRVSELVRFYSGLALRLKE
jgi:hypothetical protein